MFSLHSPITHVVDLMFDIFWNRICKLWRNGEVSAKSKKHTSKAGAINEQKRKRN
jgi:hypothetical protein